MSWLSEMLKRWRWIPHFTRDDELNAEVEDALQEQKRAVRDVQTASASLHEKSEAVRDALRLARLQVATFAQFEQRIRDLSKSRRLGS